MTLRILAVNVMAPLVLVLGLLYMGQYRENLIQAELNTLEVQAQLFAGAIAEGAVRPVRAGGKDVLVPELSRRMVRRLGETTKSRTRLFDDKGELVSDSHKLIGPGGVVQIVSLDSPQEDLGFTAMMKFLGTRMMKLVPVQSDLKSYPYTSSQQVTDYPDALAALYGSTSATAWEGEQGRILLSAAAPIQKGEAAMGVILLTQDGTDIEIAMAEVQLDVLTVFLVALSITIFLSIYLAGLIGRPLKKLAIAAEAVRQSKRRQVNIPDMSARRDEIGELSRALRDMTQALWDRMDTIESFAADVAHEIKNPLTSLRSAVETISKVTARKDRDRLLEIIQNDVLRLDRLISDISSASRLDAELSREEMSRVNLYQLLTNLVDSHKKPLERGKKKDTGKTGVVLQVPGRKRLFVNGNEGRLAQVFENLISNALSFSAPDSVVTVTATRQKGQIVVHVEDEGPGIPENKLEDIFERFYSQRPEHEDYGAHSGLGLSIAKQIVEAHDGEIYAENILDENDGIAGACFIVKLDEA